MKRKGILFNIGTLASLLLICACSNWLDVKPKVAIKEEDLFSRELGFKETLTGFYLQMGSTNLYGREMTYGFVDALARRYSVLASIMDYNSPNFYTYPSKLNEKYINSIWKNSYSIIANINNFLSWIDKNGKVITTPGYYDLMKGEALGLRAFLYFDLLRLWGPVYQHNPNTPAIPYRTKFDREDKILLPAQHVLDSIIIDLKKAEVLLENDLMNIEFPAVATDETTDSDDFLRYRFKRINKYAVKAMLARAYQWRYVKDPTDLQQAAKYAQEVISAQGIDGKSLFRLVGDNTKDRIFSTELIFSLSLNNFEKQVNNDFNMLSSSIYRTYSRGYIENMFNVDIDGYNDVRVREGQAFIFSFDGTYSLKYNQSGLYSFAIESTMPLIRLSEMYYILSECTEDLQTSARYLSMVRSARGGNEIPPFIDKEEKMTNIEQEYRKEFYAEGQLWYFYKRHATPYVYSHPLTYPFSDINYIFSIPEDEKLLGILN